MHYMILMSKKKTSQKKLEEIKLVPYNQPHFDTWGVQKVMFTQEGNIIKVMQEQTKVKQKSTLIKLR
jgi:hypothetical protein